jgi:hypothetical protein
VEWLGVAEADMDNVNNRSLFRNRSGAAREKVRQMGRVREPQGILSAFPELMRVAAPQQPMMQPQQPMMPQQMPMTLQPMMQPQQMPMPMMQQPAGFQDGGPVEPDTPSFMERVAQNAMLAAETFLPSQRLDSTPQQSFQPVDIAAAPTPREPVVVTDISTLVRETIGDNPEAQENFTKLENTLTDPAADDETIKEAVTSAAGVENTKDGLRAVVSKITGRDQPASATVDELNRAISGVALGGAIGGPRSVAARISEALIGGLSAQRETAVAREAFEAQIALAELERLSKNPLDALYGDSVKELKTEFFGDIPQYLPTLQGTLSGLPPIIAGDKDRILSIYSTAMDDSDNLLALTAKSMALLDTGEVTGFEGAASRLATRAAAALPDGLAASLGIDPENQQVSAAQQFDVIQRVLAAQLAPMLLGESGRTISDADRQRVAQILGVAIDEKGGLDTSNLAKSAFKSEAETRAAISEVQSILQRNRAAVESEFTMLAARIPGLQLERPEAPIDPAATPTTTAPAAYYHLNGRRNSIVRGLKWSM